MQNAAAIFPKAPRGHRFRTTMLRRPSFGRRSSAMLPPIAGEQEAKGGWSLTSQDAKDFLMAYSACFIAVIGLFA